ncbi:MAG: hypothetical protein JXB03_04890 [Spirochaetales bacterium]|nr:hypothetical protein [Spirochaetales bacterium]
MEVVRLPAAFKDHISAEFGAVGKDWLSRFPGLLERCVCQWELTGLVLSPHLSYNAVVFATSGLYGRVVLKMSVPNHEFFTECAYILYHQDLDGHTPGAAVRPCLACDTENHAMLLKQLSPGEDLWTVDDLHERFRLGAGLLAASPVRYDHSRFSGTARGTHEFPSFRQWMDRAYKKAREADTGSGFLYGCNEDSCRLLSEVTTEFSEPMLLHGDLHHANILHDRESGWQIIDPKGVIGPAPLECGRFIRNQLSGADRDIRALGVSGTEAERRKEEQLMLLVLLLARAFGTGTRTILKCACIDAAVSNCWSLETGAAPCEHERILREAESECRFFWDRL